MMHRIVSVSGGKDSTATYLLAIEHERPFRAVFADTMNEHEKTYEFLDKLEAHGGVRIERVKADFTKRMAKRREKIDRDWREQGVPEEKVRLAHDLMQPTGNVFVDLTLLKNRFPSTMARFCTQELKVFPIEEQIYMPLLDRDETVVSWQGVRADESLARKHLPVRQRLTIKKQKAGTLWAFRPIHKWRVEDVWAMHEKHGIARNGLYDEGFSRVGCMPCIMARKDEVRLIAEKYPEHVDRIQEWEDLVSQVSKRDWATFFQNKKTPPSFREARGYTDERPPKMHGVVEWSFTNRSGEDTRTEDSLEFEAEAATVCDEWGVCE